MHVCLKYFKRILKRLSPQCYYRRHSESSCTDPLGVKDTCHLLVWIFGYQLCGYLIIQLHMMEVLDLFLSSFLPSLWQSAHTAKPINLGSCNLILHTTDHMVTNQQLGVSTELTALFCKDHCLKFQFETGGNAKTGGNHRTRVSWNRVVWVQSEGFHWSESQCSLVHSGKPRPWSICHLCHRIRHLPQEKVRKLGRGWYRSTDPVQPWPAPFISMHWTSDGICSSCKRPAFILVPLAFVSGLCNLTGGHTSLPKKKCKLSFSK